MSFSSQFRLLFIILCSRDLPRRRKPLVLRQRSQTSDIIPLWPTSSQSAGIPYPVTLEQTVRSYYNTVSRCPSILLSTKVQETSEESRFRAFRTEISTGFEPIRGFHVEIFRPVSGGNVTAAFAASDWCPQRRLRPRKGASRVAIRTRTQMRPRSRL